MDNDARQSPLVKRVSELEDVIAGLKQGIKKKRKLEEVRVKEEDVLDEPRAIDLVLKNDTKGLCKIFRKTVKKYPLYEGERPERSNLQPMLLFNMHLGKRTGWERALYDRVSHVMSGNYSWKKERKLIYLPGCTVFIDDQRAIVYAPKTQTNDKRGFSLRSSLERFHGEDCELFYDNGLSSEGSVFYAGTYRCHHLDDIRPESGFMQASTTSRSRQIPWNLIYSVGNCQERSFSEWLPFTDFGQLISAGEIVFEFVGLQCVGFNMKLYRALTGIGSSEIGTTIKQESEGEGNSSLTGRSTRKRSREEVSSDGSDDGLPGRGKGHSSKRNR